jgi:hypothetical protein
MYSLWRWYRKTTSKEDSLKHSILKAFKIHLTLKHKVNNPIEYSEKTLILAGWRKKKGCGCKCKMLCWMQNSRTEEDIWK